jgi:uncharacterized membrane protein YeaQ/YmgE (transglycosylase-associated protein family)
METLLALIGWALFGLIAGAVARLLVPGRQAIGLGMTMLLGIAGSYFGGLIGWLLVGGGGSPLQASGWIMSILGAVLLLFLYVAFARRRGRRFF